MKHRGIQTLRVYRINLLSLLLTLVVLLGVSTWPGRTNPAQAQSGFQVVVVNPSLNVRTFPAIGAPVIANVPAGTAFTDVTARSGDSQWLRVNYLGSEGWISVVPTQVLSGNVAALPVADPRTIPFGGFGSPRSGFSTQTGPISGRASAGVRLRAGPSTAYPTLDNINFNEGFTITGRNFANTWVQVNFESTLGWVSAQFVDLLGGSLDQVPLNGIVAESPPLSNETEDDYIGILRLLRDRILIAQQSVERIRALWADASLTGSATCTGFPALISDFPIAVPLLAAFNDPLAQFQADFNAAAANTRLAINLYIEACNQPGSANPVGQATIEGALNAANQAAAQFADLLPRVIAAIPNLEVGASECLLRFNGQNEVLPFVSIGPIYLDEITNQRGTRAYCFTGVPNFLIKFQSLPVPPSGLALFVAISPLDQPDNFLLTGISLPGQLLNIGPVELPESGVYVVLIGTVNVIDNEIIFDAPQTGEFAFRIINENTVALQTVLFYDEVRDVITTSAVDVEGAVDDGTGGGGTGGPVTPVCPSLTLTCSQLVSCAEAIACFNAGAISVVDPNNDGLPCGCSGPNDIISPTDNPN